MKEECIVSKIKGKTAYISLANKQQCGGCKACALGRGKKTTVPAVMETDCKIGDAVIVETPQKDVSPFALLIYLIPLIFLGLGFFVGGVIAHKADIKNIDISRLIVAFAFMLISFIPCCLLDFLCRKKMEYMHIIKAVAKKEVDEKTNESDDSGQ